MPLTAGQGYSTPNGYRLPSGETIPATEENRRAIIRTGRRGGGRSAAEIQRDIESQQSLEADAKLKEEAERKKQEDLKNLKLKIAEENKAKLEQKRKEAVIIKGYSTYVPQEDLGNGTYRKGGTYTSTGQFYPDVGKQYNPSGYEESFADINENTITFIPKEDIERTYSGETGVYTKRGEEKLEVKIYNKGTKNEYALDKEGNPYDPYTGRPLSTITKAKSTKEQFKEAVPFKSFLDYVAAPSRALEFGAEKAKSYIERGQRKRKDYYQTEATANLAKFAITTGAYVVPVAGEALLVSSGASTVFNKDSTVKEKAIGVAEIGLAGFGVKSRIREGKIKREIKAFDKENIKAAGIRIEGEKSGVDILYAGKETKNKVYLTQIKQPYYVTKKGKVVLEGGESVSIAFEKPKTRVDLITGRVYTEKPKKIETAISEVSGQATPMKNKPRVGKTELVEPYIENYPTTVSKDIEGFTSGVSNIRTRTKYRQDIERKFGMTNKVIDDPRDIKFGDTFKGKLKRDGGVKREIIIGGSREKNGIVDFFAQRADRLTLVDGRPVLRGTGAKTFGRLKVYRPKTDEFSLNSGRQTRQVSKQIAKQIPVISPEQSLKSLLPEVKSTRSSILRTTTKVEPVARQTSSLSIQRQEQRQEQQQRQLQLSNQLQSNQSKEEVRNRFSLSSVIDTSQRDRQEQRQIQGQKQIQEQRQEQQRQITFGFDTGISKESARDTMKSFGFIIDREKEIVDKQGYNAYEYIEATKKPYYKKLNEKPLTLESAKSLMARAVDTGISARGQVRPTQGKPIDTNDSYFKRFAYKFREYASRSGTKTKTPLTFYERQRYRIDKPSELKSLQVSRFNVKSAFGL